MKVFGLIVAILLWILTSFGCTPGEAPQQPEPTQQVEDQVQPTSRPGKTPRPTKTPKPTQAPEPTQAPVSDGGDTLLPEI